jgi:hypothetical protein
VGAKRLVFDPTMSKQEMERINQVIVKDYIGLVFFVSID